MIQEIKIDNATGVCTVKTVAGEIRRATPASVGMALLSGIVSVPQQERPTASAFAWDDFLPTNGVAVGTRGQDKIIAAYLADVPRQCHHSSTRRLVKFPLMLGTMLLSKGTFVRGQIWLVDPTKKEQVHVNGTTPVLKNFPFGNVYSASGMICWGSVGTREIRTLKQMDDVFFASGFNGDLLEASMWWEQPNPGAGNAVNMVWTGGYGTGVATAIQSLLRER